MDKETFYDILDIESPEDFEYFESVASLMESEEDIDDDLIYHLLRSVDRRLFAEMFDSYFEEMMSGFSEFADPVVYIQADTAVRALKGMCVMAADDADVVRFADELSRFRRWFALESLVVCGADAMPGQITMPVRDAIMLHRLENLGGARYSYDFSECPPFDMEEYAMAYADIARSDGDGEEDPEDN